MKTIDWTKPILVNGAKGRVLSVFKGSAFVTWNDELFATAFDEQGRRYGCSYPEVTNEPEEPKDHIRLWHDGDNWRFRGISGVNPRVQPVTKTEAEAWLHGPAMQKRTIVKVPV